MNFAYLLPLLWLLIGCQPNNRAASAAAADLFIRDTDGRALILHGINDISAAKHAPGGHGPVTEADVERRAQWGFNVVRYLIFWRWIEPEKGVFDTAYLDEVARRIRWYADRGIHVVLDMHQDIYGYAVNGNGAPAWATETDGVTPVDIGTGPWWLQNIDPAVKNAWRNFWEYTDHRELQDHYILAWQFVAEYFRDEPAVIGYDLMNEPFAGTFHQSVFEDFEQTWLSAFYRRLIPALRQVDPDRYLFFEPQSLFVVFGRPSNLLPPADPRNGAQRLVFAPHLYPFYFHEGDGLRQSGREELAEWEVNRRFEMTKFGAPLFVGEFGGSDQQEDADEYYRSVMAMFDRMGASWALWSGDPGSWGPVDGDGNETAKMNHLVRPFPRSVAGTPTTFSFDPDSGAFTLSWDSTAVSVTDTTIFLPERHYPDGWDIDMSDRDGTWTTTWNAERRWLIVTHDPSLTRHTITIRPR
ncbi:MAG: glycoside hydrolase family 5 protein, partial [Candidatus Dadabacteria bacterium]